MMKVREKVPCEYYAVQATDAGDVACDWGRVRWNAGDWLLFGEPPTRARLEPYLVVLPEAFERLYEVVS
jgi:hypothetical protein